MFRHWVRILHRGTAAPTLSAAASVPSPVHMYVLKLRGSTPVPGGDAFAPALGPDILSHIQTSAGGDQRSLPGGPSVLRGVFEQWRRLRVWVLPDDTLVRVEGKNRDEDAGGVARDDLWMSFGIGLQWCSRFTKILPSDAERLRLVEYMRAVRVRVHRAVSAVLRDGGVELDGPAAAAVANAPAAAVPVPPAPPVDPRRDEALVVVAAVVAGMSHGLQEFRTLLRILLLACSVDMYYSTRLMNTSFSRHN